ncbi:MAG: HEAT repeat domain-containing protein [Planctomycetota bacterium]
MTGALVALGRIQPGDEAVPLISRYLGEQQEYAETAALALGMTGAQAALPILLQLAEDGPEARKLCKDKKVNYRTRAFALYGLGIWCTRSDRGYDKARVQRAVIGLLDDRPDRNRERRRADDELRQDTQVACLHALRLCRADPTEPSGEILRREALEFLLYYLADEDRPDLVRAHAVSALAGVLGRDDDPTGKGKARLLELLGGRREQGIIHQSCVMGLGRVGHEDDRDLIKDLARYADDGKDRTARFLAYIAIGRIAGDDSRNYLMGKMRNAKTQERNWLVLALGLLDDTRRQRSGATDVDRTIGEAILQAGRKIKIHDNRGAYAVALGMQGYVAGAPLVRSWIKPGLKMIFNGYFAEGLGLMRDGASLDAIRGLVDDSLRHPGILAKAVLALGQIGDRAVAPFLMTLLREQSSAAVMAGVSQALGQVGTEKEAEELLRIVADDAGLDLARGFAAVAVGLMGEPTKLPWHLPLSDGINYLAQTETLVGGGNGVLEIL